MGDMGDLWRDVKADRAARREAEEPQAMDNAKRRLEAVGAVVAVHDPWSFKVTRGRHRVHYFPLSGWYQGTVTGRGIRGLLKALEVPRG